MCETWTSSFIPSTIDEAEVAYHFSVGLGRPDRSVCKWKASVLLGRETKLALLLEQGQFGQKKVSLSSAERTRSIRDESVRKRTKNFSLVSGFRLYKQIPTRYCLSGV